VLAVEHLHSRDIVYRDLKPENVLIDKEGYIRITDFGLSKMSVESDRDAESMCGTPEYLAPEVLMKQGYGKQVDWWCLGCIIVEMLSGEPPFNESNRQQLFEKIKFGVVKMPIGISTELQDLLTKLFQKDPRKRIGYCTFSLFRIRR
jgi:serine/threonine protein kinase